MLVVRHRRLRRHDSDNVLSLEIISIDSSNSVMIGKTLSTGRCRNRAVLVIIAMIRFRCPLDREVVSQPITR